MFGGIISLVGVGGHSFACKIFLWPLKKGENYNGLDGFHEDFITKNKKGEVWMGDDDDDDDDFNDGFRIVNLILCFFEANFHA